MGKQAACVGDSPESGSALEGGSVGRLAWDDCWHASSPLDGVSARMLLMLSRETR
jgi:hypothetical protein